MAAPGGKVPAKILNIENLSDRHYGVTLSLGNAYTEAATVCLARHHSSPVDFDCIYDGSGWVGVLGWTNPSDRVTSAFANAEEATRDGAYAVSFAAVEAAEGLVAVARAEKLTGADYYLAPGGATDLEAAYRLEVSGTDTDNASIIRQRLREKVAQTQAGNSNLPAIASVVGFRLRQLGVEKVAAP